MSGDSQHVMAECNTTPSVYIYICNVFVTINFSFQLLPLLYVGFNFMEFFMKHRDKMSILRDFFGKKYKTKKVKKKNLT